MTTHTEAEIERAARILCEMWHVPERNALVFVGTWVHEKAKAQDKFGAAICIDIESALSQAKETT